MLRVRDIMTPHVVTLMPEESLREAIGTLVTCRIGGAPVLDGERVVGVLSAPDVLEFQATMPIATVTNDEEEGTILEPVEDWREDEESPSAFFTDLWSGDRPVSTGRFEMHSGPEWDFLEDHTVGEAMSRAICALPDTLEVSLAAQRMLALGAQRAIVTEQGRLAGILTTTDILRAVAERRLTVRQFVFD